MLSADNNTGHPLTVPKVSNDAAGLNLSLTLNRLLDDPNRGLILRRRSCVRR